jgi:hypothetical protein
MVQSVATVSRVRRAKIRRNKQQRIRIGVQRS